MKRNKRSSKRPRRTPRRTALVKLPPAELPNRWNANPDDVRRSVVKLVLTLVDFIRQLLERQAIRRVGAGTLTADETEAIGLALMRLEETVGDLCRQFDLSPEELNLELGTLGTLSPRRTKSTRASRAGGRRS
jgi:hypothetical protein